MAEGDSILETIFDDDHLEDVEMLDVEEGEYLDRDLNVDSADLDLGKSSSANATSANQRPESKNRRRRSNKKKNKKRKGGPSPNVMDVNRFVLDTCRRLKEKKSYMVYTAVGCLGVSALTDIVRECVQSYCSCEGGLVPRGKVDAVQSCGGQMTSDGKRLRTGGGVLWSIIKAREPMAYKEIMKKAKEFEKQFSNQNVKKPAVQRSDSSCQQIEGAVPDDATVVAAEDSGHLPQIQLEPTGSGGEEKHKPVHDRIRVPVSYDDLFADPKTD